MFFSLLLIVIILLLLNRNRKVLVVPTFVRNGVGRVKNAFGKKDTMVVIRPDADKPQHIDERASYYYNGEQQTSSDGVSDEDRRWYDTVYSGGSSTKTELKLCNCGASHDSMCGCGK